MSLRVHGAGSTVAAMQRRHRRECVLAADIRVKFLGKETSYENIVLHSFPSLLDGE